MDIFLCQHCSNGAIARLITYKKIGRFFGTERLIPTIMDGDVLGWPI